MKLQIWTKAGVGAVLCALPLLGGCEQSSSKSASLVSTAQAEPALTNNTDTTPMPLVATNASADIDIENPPVPVAVPGADKEKAALPSTLNASSPAAGVAKLAQSGVSESVMLTYVSNSNSGFNLTSDEIVYLNDIGVPDSVMSAMMQRDQENKSRWANNTVTGGVPTVAATPEPQPQPEAEAQTAVAPSYVNPPQGPQGQPVVTEAVPAQPANVTYNYFNETLSPYGSWVEVDGYGRCWQPTVVIGNPNWQPYSDRGRWVYTDAGWYWMSDYSWGATTFHYGRWFRHARFGWCWWPDRVWGPSWVSWRYADDYCGWAPLPPHSYYRPGFGFSYYGRSVGVGFDFGLNIGCFTFVGWNHFNDRHPYRYREPARNVTKIYNRTTIINNVVTGDNNRIINRGVGVDRVRQRTGTDVRQVNIREVSPGTARAGRQERFDRDGRTLVVSRPQIVDNSGTATSARGSQTREGRRNETPRAGQPAGAPNVSEGREVSRDRNAGRGNENFRTPSGRTEQSGSPARVTPSTRDNNNVTVPERTRNEGQGRQNDGNRGRGGERQNAVSPSVQNNVQQPAGVGPAPVTPSVPVTRGVEPSRLNDTSARGQGAENRTSTGRQVTPAARNNNPAANGPIWSSTYPTPARTAQPTPPVTQPAPSVSQPAPTPAQNPVTVIGRSPNGNGSRNPASSSGSTYRTYTPSTPATPSAPSRSESTSRFQTFSSPSASQPAAEPRSVAPSVPSTPRASQSFTRPEPPAPRFEAPQIRTRPAPTPRVEAPRVETPRVEAPRSESRSVAPSVPSQSDRGQSGRSSSGRSRREDR